MTRGESCSAKKMACWVWLTIKFVNECEWKSEGGGDDLSRKTAQTCGLEEAVFRGKDLPEGGPVEW